MGILMKSYERTFYLLTELKSHHVGEQCLSTNGNIYESTHAHYDGKIYTCILFTNETQVAFIRE